MANLTILAFQRKDPNFLEYVITNEEAKEKFTITDTGLLHTKASSGSTRNLVPKSVKNKNVVKGHMTHKTKELKH